MPNSQYSINRILNSISFWGFLTLITVIIFFGLSVRWSLMDNSPPAWDQGLYLYQSAVLHFDLAQNGFFHFVSSLFNIDRGRVPLLPAITQLPFYLFKPSLDAAVIFINFAWFIFAWALFGLARDATGMKTNGEKAGFFAFVLFGLYPLTTMLSHNFLVEFPLVAFICASIYSLWLTHKTGLRKWSIISGIFIGLGMLTKVTFSAFIGPAFIFLIYRNIRIKSVGKTFFLFLPTILLGAIIPGPYYMYNFNPIIQATIFLSSHDLAELYNFDGAFDIHAIYQYLFNVLANPTMIIVTFFAAIILILRLIQPREKSKNQDKNSQTQTSINTILFLWFIVPFLFALLSEIKDPRYVYPSLIPIFILAGVAIARYFRGKLATTIISLICLMSLPGYLFSNGLLSENSANRLRSLVKMGSIQSADAEASPDSKDWKTDELVRAIAQNLDAQKENKNVFFLGGNRYYHLNLLKFEGLMGSYHLAYNLLPYYSNPTMSLDEAIGFIKDSSPDGIIYKSGENWPEFSSRLDSEIVSRLKADPSYKTVDLNIQQPDGSRFTLFINLSQAFVSINSAADVIGNWQAGSGTASIASNDAGDILLTDEKGNQVIARIQDGAIYALDWNVSGKLTADLQSIHWSNGFKWKKVPSL